MQASSDRSRDELVAQTKMLSVSQRTFKLRVDLESHVPGKLCVSTVNVPVGNVLLWRESSLFTSICDMLDMCVVTDAVTSFGWSVLKYVVVTFLVHGLRATLSHVKLLRFENS